MFELLKNDAKKASDRSGLHRAVRVVRESERSARRSLPDGSSNVKDMTQRPVASVSLTDGRKFFVIRIIPLQESYELGCRGGDFESHCDEELGDFREVAKLDKPAAALAIQTPVRCKRHWKHGLFLLRNL